MELYKKHRPKTLDELVGNEGVVSALKKSIKSNSLPHTILLSGPSGCGKTTIARILKKELGCNGADYEEYNCSDRNGVEFGREIISRMSYKPVNGKCRIWLLDECHQISTACANLLLKPLEDTPEHVYFILSTSEPEKLIPALKTRATQYSVQSLSNRDIGKLLEQVCKEEKIKISEESKELLIENCKGSARLALVLLEQISGVSEEEVFEIINESISRENLAIDLCRALVQGKKWSEVRQILSNMKEDPEKVRRSIIAYASKVLLGNNSGSYERAFVILQCFEDNFYNSGNAGLIRACYEATTA